MPGWGWLLPAEWGAPTPYSSEPLPHLLGTEKVEWIQQ